MYVPSAFRPDDPALAARVMREFPFATLFGAVGGEPFATHLPLLFDPGGGPHGTLRGHVARANPHREALEAGAPALAVFAGPHAYVSPRWNATERAVPTWNYVAVHARGRPRVVEEEGAVLRFLEDLTAAFEPEDGWLPPRDEWLVRLLPAIVAFEMEVEALAAKVKLGQNRPAADQAGWRAALAASDDPLARALAQWE